MMHFYDGQIRRYLTQTIRILSNFTVRYGDGTLVRVPVLYGDADRQASTIIRQNSENKINSVPRISVYISSLSLDKDRLADATFVGKMHLRERGIDPITGEYNNTNGRNYTVERLMPTPFKLALKVDIWSANTDQKLQLLEQILMFFNPSLELQTNENYLDWTSLSVLYLNDVNWSSRQVPVGTDSPIDIATITLDTPIWISPPVKVKQLGVITNIITGIWGQHDYNKTGYVEGLGIDTAEPTPSLAELITKIRTTITRFNIQVYDNQVILLGPSENVVPAEPVIEIPIRQGHPINWTDIFAAYGADFISGVSRIFLSQVDGSEIVGTFDIDDVDPVILNVVWDPLTLQFDSLIDSHGLFSTDQGFDQSSARSKVDAIVNPQTFNPLVEYNGIENIPVKLRFIIIEDMGAIQNEDGADAWKSTSGVDLIARANDIIEWTGSRWNVIFDSNQERDTMVWQTNIYTGVQYLWNGVSWVKSFEGVYKAGLWKIEL